MNIVPVELADNFEKAEFDGVWRFSPKIMQEKFAPAAFGEINRTGITPVPEEEWEPRMRDHVRRYKTGRVVCYCNACLAFPFHRRLFDKNRSRSSSFTQGAY